MLHVIQNKCSPPHISQELFVARFAQEAARSAQLNKKKTVQMRDIKSSIEAIDGFRFLEGAID